MTQQQINDLKQSLISLINSKLADQSTIIASEHRDVETAIVDSIFTDKSLKGDIKEIACNQQYIIDNFEPSSNTLEEGKAFSTSERVGWAICNGKNGTVNKMGRVAIGYDPINYQLGSVAGSNTGGAKTHTLSVNEMPIHNHNFTTYDANDLNWANSGYNFPTGSDDNTSGRSYLNTTDIGNKGGNQAHNNMQPYIVTLFIQKIS
jgi:hypothetical protein